MKKIASYYKFILAIIIILIAIIVYYKYDVGYYFSINAFNKYSKELMTFSELHFWQCIAIYTTIYILLIACCAPGTIVLDLFAGYVFNAVLATLLVVFSYTLGAVINFLIINKLFKSIFEKKFHHLHSLINDKSNKNSVVLSLIGLRFIPIIPFGLINILAAILDVKLKVFIYATLIGVLPVSIIYVLLGNGLHGLDGTAQLSWEIIANPKLWMPLVLMATIVLIPVLYKIIKQKLK